MSKKVYKFYIPINVVVALSRVVGYESLAGALSQQPRGALVGDIEILQDYNCLVRCCGFIDGEWDA